MRIVAYTNLDGDAPAGMEAVARIVDIGRDAKGRSAEVQLPIIIYGRTPTEAIAKAQAWWDAEIAKERAKAEGRQRRAEAMRAGREAKSQPKTSEAAA